MHIQSKGEMLLFCFVIGIIIVQNELKDDVHLVGKFSTEYKFVQTLYGFVRAFTHIKIFLYLTETQVRTNRIATIFIIIIIIITTKC